MWAVGDRLEGRFELLRRAAVGGSGIVFRARDHLGSRIVAVKIVRLASAADHVRFEREARWLAAFDHPNIVRFVAHGALSTEEHFLAMEWVAGETLAERLKREELSPRDAVLVVRAVARGLGELHARGIVHRDVKPANVMLVEGDVGRVKLLDFGIARAADEDVTKTGALVGTPGYMAPEQIRNDPVGPPADVFGLACVLYRCLAGRAPFAAAHVPGSLTRALYGLADPLAKLRPELPERLVYVVERAMRPDPEDRFADAGELERALAELDLSSHASPRPESAPGVGDTERRLACLLTIRLPCDLPLDTSKSADPKSTGSRSTDPKSADPTSPDDVATRTADDEELRLVNGVLAAWGCGATRRDPQTLEAIVLGRDTAKDLASTAARAAVALRSALPRACITVVTGRSHISSSRVDDELRLRASALDAPPRSIAIDSLTARLLESRFDVTHVDSDGYLLGDESEATITTPSATTHFVGRSRELAMLDGVAHAWEEQGCASAAVLVGPCGVGKTRLLQELLAAHPRRRAIWARADVLARRSPFGLLSDLAGTLLGLSPTSSPTMRRAAVDTWVARFAAATSTTQSVFLGRLVGASPPTAGESAVLSASVESDPVRFAEPVREAFLALLEVETRVEPLWLVLDDLQWADPASLRAIEDALTRLAERPLVILAAGRPDFHRLVSAPWPGSIELGLGELPPRAAEELVRRALPEATDELVARILAHGSGNALFLSELVDAARRGDEAPPESVLAVVQTRLERLSSAARRVARALSIYAVRSASDAVRALLVDDAGFEVAVDELERAQVIATHEASEERWLEFRSPLVREAAYAMLSADDRRAGHRLAAQWLTARGERSALRLAEHWANAGDAAQALDAFELAAERALEAGDWDATRDHVARALSFGPSEERAARIEVLAHEALAWSGRHAEMTATAERIFDRLPRGGEAWSRVAAGTLLAGGSSLSMARAFGILREICTSPLPDSASFSAIRAHAWAAAVSWRAGHPDIAGALVDELVRVTRGSEDPAILGWVALASHYRSRFVTRDAGAARRTIESAVLSFERAGDRFALGLALAELAYEHLTLGAHDEALAIVLDACRVATSSRARVVQTYASSIAALCLSRVGRTEEARERTVLAVQLADATEGGVARAYARHIGAMVSLAAGEIADARRWLDEARALAVLPSPHQPWLDATESRVLLAEGDPERAVQLAERAVEAMDRCHIPDLAELWILGAHAEALAAASREEDARAAARRVFERAEERAASLPEEWRDAYRARPELATLRSMGR